MRFGREDWWLTAIGTGTLLAVTPSSNAYAPSSAGLCHLLGRRPPLPAA